MMKTTMKAVILIITLVSAKAIHVSRTSRNWFETEEDPVELLVFNFQDEKSPVTSSLIHSKNDAILFDAQFGLNHANTVVSYLRDANIKPGLVIITSGDPDYYFGLQTVLEAFPFVDIVASPRVVNWINQTKDQKLATWGPELVPYAPTELYVPNTIDRDTYYLDNRKEIQLMEINSPEAYVWIPENKVILGGNAIYWEVHVWVVNSRTPETRAYWRQVLRQMLALEPRVVIPGHWIGERPIFGDEPIRFTLQYLEIFEEALERNNYRNSTAVIAYMKERYPNLALEDFLELSAKVLTGEPAVF
ncbi:uncharacterized protein LOC135844537 [Planococcus citri]|uniref:uncharacterized protein LOC135844537 n=1 Tax=Planococcus citri TaxID=170843 RepID=UPI0031F96E97